mgnify:CR=1 FL=1
MEIGNFEAVEKRLECYSPKGYQTWDDLKTKMGF